MPFLHFGFDGPDSGDFEIDYNDETGRMTLEFRDPERDYIDECNRREKFSHILDLGKRYERGENVLEILCEKEFLEYRPCLDEEYEQLVCLIERHSSKFPLKLRTAVAAAKLQVEEREAESEAESEPCEAEFIYYCFGRMVRHFLFGFTIEGYANLGWHGPNFEVDTEDQLELVLRLCPTALIDMYETDFERLMESLANSAKAVRFIPLLFKINPHLCNIVEVNDLSALLLNNDGVSKRSDLDSDEAPFQFDDATPERDKESFSAFRLLMLRDCNSGPNMYRVFERFLETTIDSSRNFAFMEERLRFLIQPGVMVDEEGGQCDLNLMILKECNEQHKNKFGSDVRFYELMLEMGTSCCPTDLLGLGFHVRNFEVACDIFGKEPVKQAMNDKIANTLAKSKNKKEKMLGLVSEAATNKHIHLNGLYTLIRFDPSILPGMTSKL